MFCITKCRDVFRRTPPHVAPSGQCCEEKKHTMSSLRRHRKQDGFVCMYLVRGSNLTRDAHNFVVRTLRSIKKRRTTRLTGRQFRTDSNVANSGFFGSTSWSPGAAGKCAPRRSVLGRGDFQGRSLLRDPNMSFTLWTTRRMQHAVGKTRHC